MTEKQADNSCWMNKTEKEVVHSWFKGALDHSWQHNQIDLINKTQGFLQSGIS